MRQVCALSVIIYYNFLARIWHPGNEKYSFRFATIAPSDALILNEGSKLDRYLSIRTFIAKFVGLTTLVGSGI